MTKLSKKTATAKAAIEKAGGSVKLLAPVEEASA